MSRDVAIVLLFILGLAALFALPLWLAGGDPFLESMRAIPRKRIADVLDGEQVRIVGVVEARETVTAPLTGRPCAYWRVVVRERRLGTRPRFVQILEDQDGTDFVVRDETGSAKVIHESVNAQLADAARFDFGGLLESPTPAVEAYLRSHPSLRGVRLSQPMQLEERIVQHGDRLCAVGTGHWEAAPEGEAPPAGGYRESQQPKRLVVRRGGLWLTLTDHPKLLG